MTKKNLKQKEIAIEAKNLNIFYGDFRAVKNVNIKFEKKKITAIIGSSGCGKSTLIRSFNRMNDQIDIARVEGEIIYQGENIYHEDVDPVLIRKKIGMVFQKPNPFPKSIYDNIVWGAKRNRIKGNYDDLVEQTLRDAALWDDVKDNLHSSALSLNNGQQQRLCIARTIAIQPEIILMDEPASALDPIATLQIEELMFKLSKDYTIIIVTHNMQQAARASDYCAFFNMDTDRAGVMIEFGKTDQIFTNPKEQLTEDYITGRFG